MSDDRTYERNITGMLAVAAVVIVAAGTGLWLYDRSEFTTSLGQEEVDVEFEIVEAGTHTPVSGAVVAIWQNLGGLQYASPESLLEADAAGKVVWLCTTATKDVYRSRLEFTTGSTVYAPLRIVSVTAEGYLTAAPAPPVCDVQSITRSGASCEKLRFRTRIELMKDPDAK
jgi:hypothetical protein